MSNSSFFLAGTRDVFKNPVAGATTQEAQKFRASYLKKVEQNARKEDFAFREVIGNGQFGYVYLAVHVREMKEYAIKVMYKETLVQTEKIENIYREKQVLANLSHPFIINCPYYFMDDVRIYLVTPYISRGDLYYYIMWSQQVPDERVSKFYSAQIILALEYLHRLHIIHRDLKPENLMVDEQGFIKLIDFGLCSVFKKENRSMCGTRQYMAPEILSGKTYGRSVDYWALGVVIYELNSFELPFDDEDPLLLTKAIISGKFTSKKEFSEVLEDLLLHLLDVNPLTRFGSGGDLAHPIKRHAWFNDIDFSQLYLKKVKPPTLPPKRNSMASQHPTLFKTSKMLKKFEEFDHF